jgi:hypothetical protein
MSVGAAELWTTSLAPIHDACLVEIDNLRNLPTLGSPDDVADNHGAFQSAFAPDIAKARHMQEDVPLTSMCGVIGNDEPIALPGIEPLHATTDAQRLAESVMRPDIEIRHPALPQPAHTPSDMPSPDAIRSQGATKVNNRSLKNVFLRDISFRTEGFWAHEGRPSTGPGPRMMIN